MMAAEKRMAAEQTSGEPKPRPFKVLISSYACRPNAGSEVGIGWNWALHLAQAGCIVDVLTAARNREANEGFLALHPIPNLRFHFVEVPWLPPWEHGARHYLLWQWQVFRQARRLVRQERFDLALHVSYGSVHLPTQLWRLRLPTIFGPVGGGQVTPKTLLGYFGAQQRTERLRTALTRFLPRIPVYRRSMQNMRVVFAANSDTVALAKSAGCRDVRLLCDTGLREDYIAESPRHFHSSGGVRMLWVGRFMPRKGLALALDALQHASRSIHLTLVGDGMEPSHLELMLAERGLTDRVHWSGARLSWIDVREMYRTYDALLFTSLRDSFGSQLLEAMSQGLPIVALSLGGARDFVPADGGIKVELGEGAQETVQRLTKALDQFEITSDQERNSMSEAVWRTAQNFTWDQRASVMIDTFAEVTRDPQREL